MLGPTWQELSAPRPAAVRATPWWWEKRARLLKALGDREAAYIYDLDTVRAAARRGRHLVTVRTEHKSVLDPCKQLEKEGASVAWLNPTRSGRIEPAALAAALVEGLRNGLEEIIVGDVARELHAKWAEDPRLLRQEAP